MAISKKRLAEFEDYEDIRRELFTPEEIQKNEAEAALEIAALRSMQESLSRAIAAYMSENDLGFVEFTKRLGTSTRQTSRILKGEANVTLATLAEVAVHIGKVPKIVFEDPPRRTRSRRTSAKKRA